MSRPRPPRGRSLSRDRVGGPASLPTPLRPLARIARLAEDEAPPGFGGRGFPRSEVAAFAASGAPTRTTGLDELGATTRWLSRQGAPTRAVGIGIRCGWSMMRSVSGRDSDRRGTPGGPDALHLRGVHVRPGPLRAPGHGGGSLRLVVLHRARQPLLPRALRCEVPLHARRRPQRSGRQAAPRALHADPGPRRGD